MGRTKLYRTLSTTTANLKCYNIEEDTVEEVEVTLSGILTDEEKIMKEATNCLPECYRVVKVCEFDYETNKYSMDINVFLQNATKESVKETESEEVETNE